MKTFEMPKIEVIKFAEADVIVTSTMPCVDHWCSQCHGEVA